MQGFVSWCEQQALVNGVRPAVVGAAYAVVHAVAAFAVRATMREWPQRDAQFGSIPPGLAHLTRVVRKCPCARSVLCHEKPKMPPAVRDVIRDAITRGAEAL